MLLNVALLVAILVIALVAYVATQPATFHIHRKARIDVPPDSVFPLLADFHRWDAWSPWEKIDPGMTRRHSGAASGRGAVYEWAGNKKVGSGRMEIVEATAPSHLAIKLDFLAPWQAHNTTAFTLAPNGGATDVTWAMHGPNQLMGKVMGLFMPMDKLVGKDFERGLENLKRAVES